MKYILLLLLFPFAVSAQKVTVTSDGRLQAECPICPPPVVIRDTVRLPAPPPVIIRDTVHVQSPTPPTAKTGKKYYPVQGYGNGYFTGDQGTFKPLPGDTLYFRKLTKDWGRMYFEGLNGEAGDSIVIMCDPGVRLKVYPEATSSPLMKFDMCSYIKIIGFDFIPYDGNNFTKGVFNLEIRRSKNIEIANNRIIGGQIGIVIEDNGYCDSKWNYPNFALTGFLIHDNYITRQWSQAMYLGNTAPDGTRDVTCGNAVLKGIMPARVGGFNIYNNYIDSTGRPGIQLSGASEGTSYIYNNTVKHSGLQGDKGQAHNIAIGAYSKVVITGNTLISSFTDAFSSIAADGEVVFSNNKIDSFGFLNPYIRMMDGSVTTIDPSKEKPTANTINWAVGARFVARDKKTNAKQKPIAKNNTFGYGKSESLGLLAQGNWFDSAIFCGNVKTGGKVTVKTEDYGTKNPTPYTLTEKCN